ncbi:hypothetical protein RO3G_06208 [Rhizopus delemar RA 99-880]|uniref:Uncharacterized protein n=1 Tax=Rhizopus delemar (strain RA 99-880 / ATCC MYA-4621 / FGSC 9543 / NRRL 43880) TaxID=246409 RepID=I1BZ73_RHIO9|nr:hypothetical protein RO3G_06208 [Rhizopus delemar RA 99-880]|eukprot:EIE81503.1 hypothetical protein RO3G_06208 [Rhizopus delemar RA 99-880]
MNNHTNELRLHQSAKKHIQKPAPWNTALDITMLEHVKNRFANPQKLVSEVYEVMPGKEILYAVNEARHSYSDEELKKTKVTFHGLRT